MAISKIILNGVTQMDVTGVSVQASNLIAPNTAIRADGEPVVGTATEKTLTTKTITANGTYDAEDDNADGYSSVTVNVPSSGGASNLVTGTFKGTTTGAAMDVSLNYTGSGYPIAVSIYPTSGYGSDTSIYSTLQRYAIIHFSAIKRTMNAPTYDTSGDDNAAFTGWTYKSSSSTASTLTASSSQSANTFRGGNASNTNSRVATFKDKTTMSVYIASNSYGFMANVEYTYCIIYSS